MRTGGPALHQAADQHCRVDSFRAAQLRYLVAARCAWRYEHVIRLHTLRRGQQAPVSNGLGYLVMLARVSERACHAATAGVQIDYGRLRDAPKER